MKEIYPNLFIGSQADYEGGVSDAWKIIQACKEPYHREALGYTGSTPVYGHPEYLAARRGNRLILNMVDSPNPLYILKCLVDESLDFIHESLAGGCKILVHCNEGRSRSPMIGLMYLAKHTEVLPAVLGEALARFSQLVPRFSPGRGVSGFLSAHFDSYRSR